MLERMIGAAMLRASTYEEIEADNSALPQAIGVVIIVTLCGIVGNVIAGATSGGEEDPLRVLWAVLNGGLFGLLRWALWVTLILLVGGKILKTDSTNTNWAELGRVVGFAYVPGVITLLAFLPGIGSLMGYIAFFWTLVAVVIAIRHALDFEGIGRAIVVAVITGIIGFIPWLILVGIQGGVASNT